MNPYVCIMHTRLPFLTARMATLLELAVLATQVFLDTVLIMEFIFSSLCLCFALSWVFAEVFGILIRIPFPPC